MRMCTRWLCPFKHWRRNIRTTTTASRIVTFACTAHVLFCQFVDDVIWQRISFSWKRRKRHCPWSCFRRFCIYIYEAVYLTSDRTRIHHIEVCFQLLRGDISRVFQSYLFSLLLQYGRRAASGGNRENVSYKQLYILVDSCYRVERRNWIFTLSWNLLVTCYSFILCVEASTAVDDRPRCNHVQGSACKWTLQIQGKDPWKRAVMGIRCPAAQRHPPAGL